MFLLMLAPFYALQSGNFWCKVLIILYSQASICYHGKRMSLKFCSIFFYSWYNILCFIEILLSLVGTTHKHCISLLGAGIATGIEDIFLLIQICQGFWMGCRGIFLFFFLFSRFYFLLCLFIYFLWVGMKEGRGGHGLVDVNLSGKGINKKKTILCWFSFPHKWKSLREKGNNKGENSPTKKSKMAIKWHNTLKDKSGNFKNNQKFRSSSFGWRDRNWFFWVKWLCYESLNIVNSSFIGPTKIQPL